MLSISRLSFSFIFQASKHTKYIVDSTLIFHNTGLSSVKQDAQNKKANFYIKKAYFYSYNTALPLYIQIPMSLLKNGFGVYSTLIYTSTYLCIKSLIYSCLLLYVYKYDTSPFFSLFWFLMKPRGLHIICFPRFIRRYFVFDK